MAYFRGRVWVSVVDHMSLHTALGDFCKLFLAYFRRNGGAKKGEKLKTG